MKWQTHKALLLNLLREEKARLDAQSENSPITTMMIEERILTLSGLLTHMNYLEDCEQDEARRAQAFSDSLWNVASDLTTTSVEHFHD